MQTRTETCLFIISLDIACVYIYTYIHKEIEIESEIHLERERERTRERESEGDSTPAFAESLTTVVPKPCGAAVFPKVPTERTQ